MQGPKNVTELRELFRSREFPPNKRGQSNPCQTPSDRMRERSQALAEVFFGLVPDSEFQAHAALVLYDLCVMGEAKLCQVRAEELAKDGFEPVSHEPLRVLPALETTLGKALGATLDDPATFSEPPKKPRKKS